MMRICPAPWCSATDASAPAATLLRPVAVTEGARAPRVGGFRERPRRVAGEANSFELPRPLLAASHHSAGLEGTAVRLAVDPGTAGTDPHPGIVLASRAASIAAWLDPSADVSAAACGALRKRLLDELDSDDPPESLIVEIAQRQRFMVESVFSDPRVQLRRRRELQLIDRVRQLDAASLRWLARQPGRSMAERAGPRERILAVRRYRSQDTLENQVLVDVVRRSIALAKEYEQIYRRYPNSTRVRDVRELRRVFGGLNQEEWVSGVRSLTSMPVPNYALLNDRRYSPMWKLWQRLLRQEQLFQSLEAWLPRLVAELVWVGCLAELESSTGLRPAFGSFPTLRFRPEFECAEFLNPAQAVPPLLYREGARSTRIDLVRSDQLIDSGFGGRDTPWPALAELRPDFAFVARAGADGAVIGCVPVWAVVTWGSTDCGNLTALVGELASRAHRLYHGRARVEPVLVAFRAAGPAVALAPRSGVTLLNAERPADLLLAAAARVAASIRGIGDAA